MKALTKEEKYHKIMEKKMSTPVEVLCRGYPHDFEKYLNYCRALRFEDRPDYGYLRRIFKDFFARDFPEDDPDGPDYDWSNIAMPERRSQNEQNAGRKMGLGRTAGDQVAQGGGRWNSQAGGEDAKRKSLMTRLFGNLCKSKKAAEPATQEDEGAAQLGGQVSPSPQ